MIRGRRGLTGWPSPCAEVTDREKDILRLFAGGKSYAQIADARGNKPSTIKNAIYRIQEKLGVESKQEIVVWAVRNRPAWTTPRRTAADEHEPVRAEPTRHS